MLTKTLLTVVLLVTTTICWSQTSLYVRNPYPGYRLSPDGKTLGVSEVSEDGNEWLNYLSLDTFKWQGPGSVSTLMYTLTPSLRSAYANTTGYSHQGFKGDNYWIAYKNYMSWYFPSSTNWDNRIQWADRDFIIAVRSDGQLLTAGKLTFNKKEKNLNKMTTIHDLNIVDPNTGKVVSTIRSGKIMDMPNTWWQKRRPVLINNDSLLVWYDLNDHIISMKLPAGEPQNIALPVNITSYIGKYGIGIKQTGFESDKIAYKRCIIDMETGRIVHDETVSVKSSWNYWVTTGSDNRIYSINGYTSMFYEEEWTGTELKMIDSIKLNVTGLLRNNYWLDPYTMLVSKPLGKVYLLPKHFKKWGTEMIEVFSWNINDGALVHRNPDFIRPFDSFVAREKKQSEIRVPEKVVLAANIRIRKHNGGLYEVLGRDPGSTLWNVIRFEWDKTNNSYNALREVKSEFDLTYQTELVHSSTCHECKGSGAITTSSQRTVEKTDKMIYNQITTTRVYTDRKTAACNVCKGLGFSVSK